MKEQTHSELGRRERQIMDVIYRLGTASVGDVRKALPDPPTYSAVRGMLRLLEDKGYVTHQADGLRYLYKPTISANAARKSAIHHLVHTFFGGSTSDAVAGLIELSDAKLSRADIARLTEIVRRAKDEGK
jgi:predicted transcriptional regulator